MTPKELLYIEDALGHEQQMKTVCTDYASQIADPELGQLLREVGNRHQNSFDRLYGLLSQ